MAKKSPKKILKENKISEKKKSQRKKTFAKKKIFALNRLCLMFINLKSQSIFFLAKYSIFREHV